MKHKIFRICVLFTLMYLNFHNTCEGAEDILLELYANLKCGESIDYVNYIKHLLQEIPSNDKIK